MFPWSRADFRHHVLRLVREYVPRSWRSCTRSSTSAIQTRFGVTSTPAPRGGSVRSRGSRAPCTVPCVSGARSRPCGPVGRGRPCSREQLGAPAFVATPNSPPVSRIQADAHEPDHRGRGVRLVGAVPLAARRIRDHRGRPNSSGRRPYRRQSACACARSSPPQGAALGVLGHARSDARTLNSFGNLAMPLFSFFHLSALLQ